MTTTVNGSPEDTAERGRQRYAEMMFAHAPAVPSVRVARSVSAEGFGVVTWSCPACSVTHLEDHEVAEDSVRCCVCDGGFAVEAYGDDEFACGACGERVTAKTGPGRTYSRERLPVPDDFRIPTCTGCGEEYLSVERAEALEATS